MAAHHTLRLTFFYCHGCIFFLKTWLHSMYPMFWCNKYERSQNIEGNAWDMRNHVQNCHAILCIVMVIHFFTHSRIAGMAWQPEFEPNRMQPLLFRSGNRMWPFQLEQNRIHNFCQKFFHLLLRMRLSVNIVVSYNSFKHQNQKTVASKNSSQTLAQNSRFAINHQHIYKHICTFSKPLRTFYGLSGSVFLGKVLVPDPYLS